MPDYGLKIEGGWFDETRHLYRNEAGTPVISSTQVFDILGMIDFSRVPAAVLDWKRQFGSMLHKCMQYLAFNDLDWDSVDGVLVSPLVAIESFLKRIEFQAEASEEMRVHSLFGMYYGMTLDLRGTFIHHGVRRHGVIDLKTGSQFSKTWDWQLGSYIFPQPKVDKGWMGIVIQVDVDGSVEPHYLKDVEAAKREFQILLSAANLKVNAGLAKIGKAA